MTVNSPHSISKNKKVIFNRDLNYNFEAMTYTSARKKKVIIGADYWNRFLASLRDQVGNMVIEIDRLRNIVSNLGNEILLFQYDWNRYKVSLTELEKIRKDALLAGVDSSLTPPLRIGPYLISAISAAAVITEGTTGNPIKLLEVRSVRAPELSDGEYANNEIKLKMFMLEKDKLGEAATKMLSIDETNMREKAIFIDGPIVDPPTFSHKNQDLRTSYEEDYVKARTKLILDILNKNILVLGIAKKIQGNSLTSYLNTRIENDILTKLNDYTLVTLILKSWSILNFLRQSININVEDFILVTKSFELSNNTDYPIYRENGLYVYSFYILPGISDPRKRVLRVEIPFDHVPSESELVASVWRYAKYVAATALPGHYVPTPVILAHRACTIPRSAAKKVMKETTSGFLAANLKERTTLGPLGAIDLSRGLID